MLAGASTIIYPLLHGNSCEYSLDKYRIDCEDLSDLAGPPGAGGPTTLQGNRPLGLTIWIKLGDQDSIPLDVTWSALQICVAQSDPERA